jgi:hypothetical protein
MVANPAGQHGHVLARPWIEVAATVGGVTHRVFCLLDTGADDTILDMGAAATLGINPLAPPQVTVGGIGRGVSFHEESNVQLDFAGTSLMTSVLFGPTTLPLLGRKAFLDASNGVDVAFEHPSWHHT